MPKFKKKPVVVTLLCMLFFLVGCGSKVVYRQFWPDKKPWPRGVIETKGQLPCPDKIIGCCVYHFGIKYGVVTKYGQWIDVAPGDWIIPEPDGVNSYPCKPDKFEQAYERID